MLPLPVPGFLTHLRLYGQLRGEHAQVVSKLGVGCDDDSLAAGVKLRAEGREGVF